MSSRWRSRPRLRTLTFRSCAACKQASRVEKRNLFCNIRSWEGRLRQWGRQSARAGARSDPTRTNPLTQPHFEKRPAVEKRYNLRFWEGRLRGRECQSARAGAGSDSTTTNPLHSHGFREAAGGAGLDTAEACASGDTATANNNETPNVEYRTLNSQGRKVTANERHGAPCLVGGPTTRTLCGRFMSPTFPRHEKTAGKGARPTLRQRRFAPATTQRRLNCFSRSRRRKRRVVGRPWGQIGFRPDLVAAFEQGLQPRRAERARRP